MYKCKTTNTYKLNKERVMLHRITGMIGTKRNRKTSKGRIGMEWNRKTSKGRIVLKRNRKTRKVRDFGLPLERVEALSLVQDFLRLSFEQKNELTRCETLKILTHVVTAKLKTIQNVPGIYIKHQQEGAENVTIENNKKVIPVEEFSRTNLPQCYQHDPEMFDLILSLADLTVKVEVCGASEEWNKFWADNKSPHDMSQIGPLISSDILIGSGKIHDMFIRTEKDGPNPCLCEKCKNAPVKEWAEILIITTAQLLYDHYDASHFSASFVFDGRPIKVQGTRIVSRSIATDVCKFMCVTCDVESLRKLEDKLDLFEACWVNACEKYAETVKWEKEKLVVIVSYPYGQKMHISLGKKITKTEDKKRIIYDTPTYPGSSGAYVLIPDFDVVDERLPFCHLSMTK